MASLPSVIYIILSRVDCAVADRLEERVNGGRKLWKVGKERSMMDMYVYG